MNTKKMTVIKLEEELKKKTGEDTITIGKIKKAKNTFNSSTFLRLAHEVKKILSEDERSTNSVVKSV